MLTLHYSSASGYPSNGDNNAYMDYTTLTTMTSDRLSESKSPLAHVIHSMDGNGTSGEAPYGYYENLDASGHGSGYGHSPLAYSQGAGKPANFDYALQSAAQPDSYNSSTAELIAPMPHQISVTIGPGTTQQRTLPVIYDPMQAPKGEYSSTCMRFRGCTCQIQIVRE